MSKKDQTTVNLSEKAQAIKDDLAPLFGLKNILSAGLILFGNLTSDQQKRAIAESNGAEPETMPPATNRAQRIGQLLDEFRNLALSEEAPELKVPARRGVKKVAGH